MSAVAALRSTAPAVLYPAMGVVALLAIWQALSSFGIVPSFLLPAPGRVATALWSSTLPRARETAAIIGSCISHAKVRPVGVLREGMYSKVKGYEVPASERQEDRARADLAYDRFFRTSRSDRLELVVCHGNLIRYLVCRAMDVPGLRWTRMNSNHCGMTRILVRDSGAVRVVSYNETAHLPAKMVT